MKPTIAIAALVFIALLQGCKDNTDPDYQTAIKSKYQALGWTLTPDGGDQYTQTKGQKGWVQYYGNKDRAIYYFPGDGDYSGGAFGMLNYEMNKYDALGQDTYAYVASDPNPVVVSSTSTVYYNEIVRLSDRTAGIIMTAPALGIFTVAGPIYQEYLRLNRWAGPLGYPKTDELATVKAGGRYHLFSKTGGTIIWSQSTGAHAYWNRVDDLHRTAGNTAGWLGFPKTSCNPSVADNKQQVLFEGGTIFFETSGTNTYCGRYINSGNRYVYANGIAITGTVPCY